MNCFYSTYLNLSFDNLFDDMSLQKNSSNFTLFFFENPNNNIFMIDPQQIIRADNEGNNNIFFHVNNESKRDKNSDDCLRKKLKHLVLKSLLGFINNKIDNKEHEIKLLEYSKTKDTKIKFEKSFMYKTIGDIFSNTISKKYTSLTKDERENNNINNIDILKKNEEIKDILDLTFVQCLNHFIGKNPNVLLNGMKTLEEYKLNDKKHEEKLKDYGLKYENSVLTSKERNRKKKKNN